MEVVLEREAMVVDRLVHLLVVQDHRLMFRLVHFLLREQEDVLETNGK